MVGASRSTGWPNWCSAGAGGVACVWDVLAAVRVDYIHDPLPPGSDRETLGNGLGFVAGLHGEISRILRMCVGFRRSRLSLSFSPGWWVCSDGCFFFILLFVIIPLICCAPVRGEHTACVSFVAPRVSAYVCAAAAASESVGVGRLFPPLPLRPLPPWNVRFKNLLSLVLLLFLPFLIYIFQFPSLDRSRALQAG